MKIELCSNLEWWRVFGPFDDARDDDATAAAVGCVSDELTRAGINYSSPTDQRTTCHGWNGANTFTHRTSGVGAFGGSLDEWEKVEIAYFRGVDRGKALIDELNQRDDEAEAAEADTN